MGYPDFAIPDAAMRDAHAFWRQQGIDANHFNICFFGTLGRQFDIDTVVRAAELLRAGGSHASFVLCGHGSALEGLREQIRGLPGVLFPGHVDASRIKALMELSALGLAPYHDTENFQLNIPNKIFEYAAGGLPVLSSVDGEVGRFLREHDIGQVYRAGDAQSLAHTLVTLEQQRDVLRAQGLRARAVFSDRFDARTISGRIEAYLQQLIEAYRSSSCPHQIS
jgi:glycosyltransferase involved in cell wall biosynthesis